MADVAGANEQPRVDRFASMPATIDRDAGDAGGHLTISEGEIFPATRRQVAERLVVERLRAVVDRRTLVLDIVQWLVRDHGAVRNGEADVVIADAERGILVIEVKSGVIRRDGTGT